MEITRPQTVTIGTLTLGHQPDHAVGWGMLALVAARCFSCPASEQMYHGCVHGGSGTDISTQAGERTTWLPRKKAGLYKKALQAPSKPMNCEPQILCAEDGFVLLREYGWDLLRLQARRG